MEVFHGMKREVEELHKENGRLPSLESLVHGEGGMAPLAAPTGAPRECPRERMSEGGCSSQGYGARGPLSAPPGVPLATISLHGVGDFLRWDPFGKGKGKGKRPNNAGAGSADGEGGGCPMRRSVFEPALRLVAGLSAVSSRLGVGVGKQLRGLRCPAPIVAMRAACAKTPWAIHLRQQGLADKLLNVGAMAVAVNLPFGMARKHTRKFSWQWFVVVHASIPFVGMWRKAAAIPKFGILFTIACAVAGQAIGQHMEQSRERLMLEVEEMERGGEMSEQMGDRVKVGSLVPARA